MPSLYVITNDRQPMEQLEAFEGDELILLVVIDKGTLATNFEDKMQRVERKAKNLEHELIKKGKKCRLIVEWGDRNEVVATALAREKAQLLS